eukprot:gene4040-4418_t
MEVIQNLQMERNRVLTESKEDIKRSENLMKSMVGNMAHDLKTPLSSFMAGVKFIEEEIIKCEEELHQCTERVDLHCVEEMIGDIWGLHGLQSSDRMQSVEGEEVDAHVEKVACLRRHLIIGLSANSDEETIEASATAGFDGFLGKPFTLAAFVSLMASLQFERGG